MIDAMLHILAKDPGEQANPHGQKPSAAWSSSG
jgi:hypothetical protein